jgi:protein gp37
MNDMGKGLHLLGEVWNPITGCTKYSDGCAHCYALDRVIPMMKNAKYKNGGLVTCHEDLLDVPRKRKSPGKFFVNNMADLFHDKVPFEFLEKIFRTINECPRHVFRALTKRTPRMLELAPRLKWTSNFWMGVTVESEKYKFRIDDLSKVPVSNRFVMFEPLIGPVGKLDLDGIDLVLVGGESGIGYRPMDPDWVREIRDQCVSAGVGFNFMQYAAIDPRPLGRKFDGRIWNDLPDDARQLSLF